MPRKPSESAVYGPKEGSKVIYYYAVKKIVYKRFESKEEAQIFVDTNNTLLEVSGMTGQMFAVEEYDPDEDA